MTRTLLSLGHGYCAAALAHRLVPLGWTVLGTTRNPDNAAALAATGVTPVLWQPDALRGALARADHLLMAAAPGPEGDPALTLLTTEITERAPHLKWAGYLSTTAVYGDHGGGWVDETTPLTPASRRGQWRVAAEQAWAEIPGLPLHIFRLAGIYGPGRGPFAKLRSGVSRRIIKPGQVFSRIHVDDIAHVLAASIAKPNPGAVYNVCDNDPAPPQDVITYAAQLLGITPPPEIPFDQADLSPMARSFYGESKRVRNDRILSELGVTLLYPDYKTGLRRVLADEQHS